MTVNRERDRPLRILEEIGHEFERAIEREQRRGSPSRRKLARPLVAIVIAIGVLFAPAGVIATRELIRVEPDPPNFREGIERAAPRDRLTPQLNSARVAATALDPDGGPLWALVVYRSETGLICTRPGRRVDSEVGSFDRSGRFRRFPREEGGSCGDPNGPNGAAVSKTVLSDVPVTARREPDRTIISGVVAPRVERLLIDLPDGRRTVRPTNLGAVLAVYPHAERRLSITIVYRDGSTARLLR